MSKPNSLLTQTIAATQHALQAGVLQPIPTTATILDDHGIPFVIWMNAELDKKIAAGNWPTAAPRSPTPKANPFLPYDQRLFVADLSTTHVCLLNKFPVYPYHLLIVTRAFEHQQSYLTLADFEAIWVGLAAIDGLAFYNGGQVAGASQSHKHLQLTPPPLSPCSAAAPVEPFLKLPEAVGDISTTALFSFQHAITRLDPGLTQTPLQAAQAGYDHYWRLLAATGLSPHPTQPAGAYNLLFTRRWMMLVPRVQESYAGISVNALGFAGSLYVRDQAHFDRLKAIGPLTLLQHVAAPK